MSKGLKIFLIFLIVVVFGAIGYVLLSGKEVPSLSSGGAADSPLETSTGEPVSGLTDQTAREIDADQIGQEFLTQLLNIRTIKLREDIFSSPSFVSLVDFTIELVQPGNEGRENPFAPFGIDAGAEASLMGTEIPMGLDTTETPTSFGPGSVIPLPPMDGSTTTAPPNITNS
jgi:hypothetical protein